MGCLFGFVVILQTILHYLGLLGIFGGVVALLFGNRQRGVELLVGGFSFIVLKYLIGILFHIVLRIAGPKEDAEKAK